MKVISIYGTASLIMIIASIAGGCSGKPSDQGAAMGSQVITVSGIVVEPKTMDNVIMATGSILANEEIELRSEISGRIRSIYFNEGSSVTRGALLVKIDDSDLQAELKKLILEEKLVNDDVFRKSKLFEIEAISREELDVSLNKQGIVKAEIELLQSKIAKTELRAPFSGRVGLRYVSVGAFINSNTLISRLQDIDPVKIEFSIPEKYFRLVSLGAPITFKTDGVDSLFTGSVYAVETKVDASTRTLAVRARCSNRARILIPGSFAQVSITLQSIPNALTVPSEAIIPDIQGERLFVATNGEARTVYVKTGRRTEREVEIIQGLSAGDTVITTGLMQLRENARIKIK